MTEATEIAAKMRCIARKKARRYWNKTDWLALAEDCEVEGWVGFLNASEKGEPEWVCWSEAVHSMTDAIVQWLYGINAYRVRTALRSERIPFQGVNFRIRPFLGPNPEQITIARDLEIKIRDRMIRHKNSYALNNTLTDCLLD